MNWEARQDQARTFLQRRRDKETQVSQEILERFKVRNVLDIVREEVWKEGEIIKPDDYSLKLVSKPIERLMVVKPTISSNEDIVPIIIFPYIIELDISAKVDLNSRKPKLVVADTGTIAGAKFREVSPLERGILLWYRNHDLLTALHEITRQRIVENHIMPGEITHLDYEDAEDRFNEVWVSIVTARINCDDLPNQMREEEKGTIDMVRSFLQLERTLTEGDMIFWDKATKKAQISQPNRERK